MSKFNMISRPALAASAAISLAACVGTMPPAPGSLASADCFSSTQWNGWSSPVDDVIYLKVRNNDVYRVDLVPGSGRNLESGSQFIISEVRGSSRICSANDLQLWMADSVGFRTPLFPKLLRKLTPVEVAALAPGDRP
jgi:hypothetical protein